MENRKEKERGKREDEDGFFLSTFLSFLTFRFPYFRIVTIDKYKTKTRTKAEDKYKYKTIKARDKDSKGQKNIKK